MIPGIATDIIELGLVAHEPIRIPHGLGRQVAGWLVIWRDQYVELKVQDPAEDTSRELVLIPSATANVRLVLL